MLIAFVNYDLVPHLIVERVDRRGTNSDKDIRGTKRGDRDIIREGEDTHGSCAVMRNGSQDACAHALRRRIGRLR